MAKEELEDYREVEHTWYEHFLLSPEQKEELKNSILSVANVTICEITPAAHIQKTMKDRDAYIMKISIHFLSSSRHQEFNTMRRVGEVVGVYFKISRLNYG